MLEAVFSQEVGDYVPVRDHSGGLAHSVENVEAALQVFVDIQVGGDIATAVAVVGSRPHRDQVLILEPVLEAIHHQLVSAGDQVEVIDVVELQRHLPSEQPAGATRRHGPGLEVFGVCPHQITERAFMGDFHASVDKSNLVKSLNIRRKATMDTKNLSLNDGADSQIVENLSAILPRVRVSVLTDGLVVEAVNSGDLPRFVVASQKSNVSRVLEL